MRRPGRAEIVLEAPERLRHRTTAEADAKMRVAEFQLRAREQQHAAAAYDAIAERGCALKFAVPHEPDRSGERALPLERLAMPIEEFVEQTQVCDHRLEAPPMQLRPVSQRNAGKEFVRRSVAQAE